jgi:hypothetical protein
MELNKQTFMFVIGFVVVFTIAILTFHTRSIENTMMRGFWRADADFCHTAELEIFVMYLGGNVSYGGNTRYGYILAKNADGFILNNSVKIDFTGGINVLPTLAHCKDYNMSIDWQDEDAPEDEKHDEEAFPSELSAAYYPQHQKLVLYSGDSVHAILYKDTKLSAMDSESSLVPDSTKLPLDSETDGEDI